MRIYRGCAVVGVTWLVCTAGCGVTGTNPLPDGGDASADASSDQTADASTDQAADAMSNLAVYTDISAGQGVQSGIDPSAVIDTANGKLLVVTDDNANSGKPALFRCNLDGTGCIYTDISAGQGAYSGVSPSAVIDKVNGKLLAVTENGANSDKPALFRCNLDGTGCTYTDISAGQGTGSGFHPRAVIDAANGKLLVVTDDFANSDKPALFRCNLDGTACTYTDISAGQGRYSGVTPSVVIDEANGKLLVVTDDEANWSRVALFRCSLDGTGCTYTDLGVQNGQGHEPSIVVDAANATLLVATSYPGLVYCKIDGTLCSFTWIPPEFPTDLGADPAASPSAVIDTIHSRLLIATDNRSNSDTPAVFRSSLGGNDWSFTDLSAGQPAGSGYRPSAVIDAVHQRLLVVTEDHGNLDKPGLFSVALW